MRFTSIFLGLLFACVHDLGDSMAHAHQDSMSASKSEIVENGGIATSINQGPPNDVSMTRLQVTRIKGRKMMMEKVMRKDEGLKGGSSEISGHATHTSRKCDHEKDEKINAEGELSCRGLLNMKVNVVGLLSFSTDYNVPRPHPPKNN